MTADYIERMRARAERDYQANRKRKKDIVEKFEIVYQKVCPHLDNLFKGFYFSHDDDKLKEVWNKMTNEKMIGILHAFTILKPTIVRAMKNSTRIEETMKFMHKNGFPTHNLANKKSFNNHPYFNVPTDSVPCINKDDATKFLEMDFKTEDMCDRLL
jgi:hypothetical protein